MVQIAEEAIAFGIRCIAFRNEQAASYAATAYGYLAGRLGVCLVGGRPGVLHAMAGIGNSSSNAFPTLFLGGSSETHLVTKRSLQEMDAKSLLIPHVKMAIRIGLNSIPQSMPKPLRAAADLDNIEAIASLSKAVKVSLLVVQRVCCRLVDQTEIPFLPTPTGKGVLPDSHHSNTSTAGSTALKEADVVLVPVLC